MTKTLSASCTFRVPFYDVDSYNIVWHGNYPKYFELARCQLLDEIDYSYPQMEDSNYLFPVIDMRVRYVKPIIFKQEIEVTATLISWQNDLTVDYLIGDCRTAERLTKGRTRQVAVQMPDHITQYQSPTVLLEKVAAALKKAN